MTEIKKEIIYFLKFNGIEFKRCPNLWDITKALLIGKFIVISAYIRNWRDIILTI